jgi:hypothetical protein
MRGALAASVLAGMAGCGSGPKAPVSTDAPVATDAPADASNVIVVVIAAMTQHFGDTVGGDPPTPQGSTWSTTFPFSLQCSLVTLDLDFVPPWGPHLATPPSIMIGSTVFGSVIPFFPPPLCQSGDCNPSVAPIHVSFPCASALVPGTNTITITGGGGDDFFIANIELRCTP